MGDWIMLVLDAVQTFWLLALTVLVANEIRR